MEGPISFWGYKEQESNLILPQHDDDDIYLAQQSNTGHGLLIHDVSRSHIWTRHSR